MPNDSHPPRTGLDAGVLRAPVGPPADALAMGGVPSTADARLSPSLSGGADLSSDAGAPWPRYVLHDDVHYRRLRDEHARALDDDYRAWRRERDARRERDDSSTAGAHAAAPDSADESPLRSLGKAVSAAVTGSAATHDPVDYRTRP